MCIGNEMKSVNAHPLTPNPSPGKAGEGSFVREMACSHFSGA